MVIFHSYVSLPEGNHHKLCRWCKSLKEPAIEDRVLLLGQFLFLRGAAWHINRLEQSSLVQGNIPRKSQWLTLPLAQWSSITAMTLEMGQLTFRDVQPAKCGGFPVHYRFNILFYKFQEIGSRWQRKWWSISDFLPYMLQRSGYQRWFVNIQHPPSRRNVKPFRQGIRVHPIAIRKSTGSRKMPLCFSCFLEKNMVSGIIWWVVWWVEQAQKNWSQLPRPGLPNCQ